MSPESLFDGVSSTKSDVWSYGVLLWEIVTCGERPYTGVATEALLDLIKDGYRMSIPLQCPQNLYQIMKSCWLMKVIFLTEQATFNQISSYHSFDLEKCPSATFLFYEYSLLVNTLNTYFVFTA